VTVETGTWVLAGLQVATAVGIVAFWSWWFHADHDTSWWPEGHYEHERVFVVPDSVLAVLLAVSAVLSLRGNAAGGQLALVAAGMMLFLGLIDGYYFARHRMFAPERDGVGNALIVLWMIGFAIVLVVRHV
jgi:hypothetical protein